MTRIAELAERRSKPRLDALLRVRVDPSLKARLEAVEKAAGDRGLKDITVSYLVREAIEALLEGVEAELELDSPNASRRKAGP